MHRSRLYTKKSFEAVSIQKKLLSRLTQKKTCRSRFIIKKVSDMNRIIIIYIYGTHYIALTLYGSDKLTT